MPGGANATMSLLHGHLHMGEDGGGDESEDGARMGKVNARIRLEEDQKETRGVE